jgi:hypothetical protein
VLFLLHPAALQSQALLLEIKLNQSLTVIFHDHYETAGYPIAGIFFNGQTINDLAKTVDERAVQRQYDMQFQNIPFFVGLSALEG